MSKKKDHKKLKLNERIEEKEKDKKFWFTVDQKQNCPHCLDQGKEVKLKTEIIEDEGGKREALVCPTHGSLFRIKRL